MPRVAPVPRIRVTVRNHAPVRPDGDFVLLWMTAARRVTRNFALDHAVSLAAAHGRPLVVLEALRCDHAYASDRFHRFVLDGMADNAARCAAAGVAYHPYVEPSRGAGRGLLRALAERAVAVVTDEFPYGFHPRMLDAAARQVPVRLEAVDGNGLLPLRAPDRDFTTAFSFRRFLQTTLPAHLVHAPSADPLAAARGLPRAAVPEDVLRRWPRASDDLLAGRASLASLPIDHGVGPAPFRGGAAAGTAALDRFLAARLATYPVDRDRTDADGTSGLSPYLHFGHVGAHQVLAEVARAEAWSPERVFPVVRGSRTGWWGMSAAAEAFLEQVTTWRELCLNVAFHRPDHDRLTSLPNWAAATLDRHRGDRRTHVYGVQDFEAGATHDPLWNAAQTTLVREGRMHNRLRMLWGKKVLEWSASPEDALATLFRLNDRYAVDGRDPNSAGGILWCLGRHDRAWGPERPVVGTVRYMSSDVLARKLRAAGRRAVRSKETP